MFWIALAATMPESAQDRWYGPAKLSFDLEVPGSPYDGQANDVQVEFESGGRRERRLAYFDGERWNVVLLARNGGRYAATVFLNGQPRFRLPGTAQLSRPAATSFVRVSNDRRGFVSGGDKPYFPVGHNLGWQDNRLKLTLTQQLAEMGKNGLNWARIWACSWDGKNPYYSEGSPNPKGRDMIPAVFEKWDQIVDAAGRAGVRFQFVLFHHGSFSSRTDPNWPGHPWNAKNGGFLPAAEEFFTHPEAIARAKNWLRYAVARWGHDPSVLAWELFNEVEWVDAFGAGKGDAVGRWHDEMADYLRSIDPYGRLVVSSSGMQLPIWRKMDYFQPHGYPPDIRALVLGTRPSADRPLFFGEVGLGGGPRNPDSERLAVRNALWSGLMAGHAGAAQYWYWDRVVLDGLYPEFAKFTKFLAEHRLGQGDWPAPTTVEVESRQAGSVAFAPGQGWAATTQFEFKMPQDAETGALGKLSGFIQGPSKKDMMAEPIRFVFESAHPGKFEMAVGSVARQGAEIRIELDGETKVSEKVPASERDIRLGKTFTVEYGAGKHTITLSNPGPDWYMADRFEIGGIGRAVTAHGSIMGRRMLLRLGNAAGTPSERFELVSGALRDGEYRLASLDLDSGATQKRGIQVKNGRISDVATARDTIWLLTPK